MASGQTSPVPTLVVPPRVLPGSAVGVVSPSSVVRAPGRLQRGLAVLRSWDLDPVVGEATRVGDTSAEARAAELNAMFGDPRIRAVLCTIGGHTAIEVLDLVDWSALVADPKAVVGYSDLTCILSAAMVHARLQVFHGPTLLPEIAEFPAPLAHTAAHLQRALSTRGRSILDEPAAVTDEFLAWGSADVRARTLTPAAAWRWSRRNGVVNGVAVGGNLETLCVLAGTRHFPIHVVAPEHRILVLETTDDSVPRTVQRLTQLRMTRLLDAAAFLVGRRFRGSVDLAACLTHVLRPGADGLLVVSDVDLGHTDPMVTVPLGAMLRLDASTKTVEVLHQ
jgi:muramoyltetrapeptide carboxypeptidase